MSKHPEKTALVDAYIDKLLTGAVIAWPYQSVPRGLWYQWKRYRPQLRAYRLCTKPTGTGIDVWLRPPAIPRPSKEERLRQRRLVRFHRNYVVMPNGCWTWIACKKTGGYAAFAQDYGHRFAYEAFKGPLPKGRGHHVDHLCRNRACVNPDHLELVPARVNLMRSPNALSAINASKTHCKRGHEFAGANVYRQIDDRGRIKRQCLACVRLRAEGKLSTGRSSSTPPPPSA